jgi:hypothetical protein
MARDFEVVEAPVDAPRWEVWQPTPGTRVRVHLSPECPGFPALAWWLSPPEDRSADAQPYLAHHDDTGRVGTVVSVHPLVVGSKLPRSHPYWVEFDDWLLRGHPVDYPPTHPFAANELEPVDA